MCLEKGGTKDLASLIRDLMQVTRSEKDYKVPSSEISEQGLQIKDSGLAPRRSKFSLLLPCKGNNKSKTQKNYSVKIPSPENVAEIVRIDCR